MFIYLNLLHVTGSPVTTLLVRHFESVEKSPSIKVHRVADPLKKPPKNPQIYIYIYIIIHIKSMFNFSQTVGEMVFVSFEVEKMKYF